MLLFLFKITLCWGFFALLYRLLLCSETFFRANRAYLLGTMALGVLLAVDFQWLPSIRVEATPLLILPTVTIGLQQAESATRTWLASDYVWEIYLLGLGFMLLRFCWALLRLLRMAIRGQAEVLPDGCLLFRSEATLVPFSFFRWIFVPLDFQLDNNKEHDDQAAMLVHERAHAQGWHSVDVVLVELLCAVFWFHPLVHWYRRALRNVHEYLADAEASRRINLKQYGLLLIRQSQSGMPVALVHHFFQSPLKQRFIMLTKKASAPRRTLKYGLLLPATLLFVFLFHQAPMIAQTPDKDHYAVSSYKEASTGREVYQLCEKMPEFPGGSNALMQFLIANLHYPPAAKTEKQEGMVVMQFIIGTDGMITSVSEPSGIHGRPDFVEEAKRVVALMPNWTPGEEKGKKVACEMTLPIKFKLK